MLILMNDDDHYHDENYNEIMTMTGRTPTHKYIIVSTLMTSCLLSPDTSREYYPSITTTRSYDDRLRTVENVRNAGISVCCGGILGLGNSAVQHTRIVTICLLN